MDCVFCENRMTNGHKPDNYECDNCGAIAKTVGDEYILFIDEEGNTSRVKLSGLNLLTEKKKETIENIIFDNIGAFCYYDRKECEELTVEDVDRLTASSEGCIFLTETYIKELEKAFKCKVGYTIGYMGDD